MLNEKNKNTFCILPWMHLYVPPDGDCQPCCMRNAGSVSFGNINDQPIEEIWNSESIKKFRKNLLEGTARDDVCSGCYLKEKSGQKSFREEYNYRFSHLIETIVPETAEDGFLGRMNLHFWDFRFSNTCNFKCRTCNPVYSSSWNEDAESMGDLSPEMKQRLKQTSKGQFDFISEQLPFVEEIYFAGGEPLMMKEHYAILQNLIRLNKTTLRLGYNSNSSRLTFGDISVLDLWKHFSDITFCPSLDEVGIRAEYLRKGTKWATILENILKIRKETPHVRIFPNLTVSIFNVMNLPQIHAELVKTGIIDHENQMAFTLTLVNFPKYYNVAVLPADLRGKAKQLILDYQEQLSGKLQREIKAFDPVLASLDNDRSEHIREFLNITAKLDQLRNERMIETFPELAGLC